MRIHPYEVAFRIAYELPVSREELEAAVTDSRIVDTAPVATDISGLDDRQLGLLVAAKCGDMLNERTIIVVSDRPRQAPVSWEVWNAPRPIYGQELWQGDFLSGIFYAAINPFDEFSNGLRYENVMLHASRLVYVTADEHRADVERYRSEMVAKYPRLADAEFDMVERSYINRSPVRIVVRR